METLDVTADWTGMARSALARNEIESAIHLLRRVLTGDACSGEAHALLSYALLRLRRVNGAVKEGRAAVSFAPESAEAHQALGSALVAANQPVEARRELDKARKIEPNALGAIRGLAALDRNEDHFENAVALLQHALEIAPDDVETLVALGDTWLGRGRIDEARAVAQRALQAEPERVDAVVLMGRVHLRAGDLAAAREHAIQALREERGSAAAITLLASIKARESFVLGLWFRMNAALAELGPKWVVVLVAAYVTSQLAVLVLQDLGQKGAADIASWSWLAFCAYTWIAPTQFAVLVRRELQNNGRRA
jgi:Flp pilus assembly protein TadD